jgi:hypothetical protein
MPIVAYGLFLVVLVIVSRDNHPTLVLNVIASGIMTLASLATYVGVSRAVPRTLASLGQIVLAWCIAGALSAILISFAYDEIWGPDPLRFSMESNIAMDIVVVIAGWWWAVIFRRIF